MRQKGTSFMQNRNRFLNEYESYCVINGLLKLNVRGAKVRAGLTDWRSAEI
jgi:hypothetical protein